MRLNFRIDKSDNITPIITIINEYDKQYIITDFNVYKIGFLNSKWITIDIEFIKSSAVRLSEYRDRRHAPIEIIKEIQKTLADFDDPVTWEESNENTNKID
jgi:hypothetical protein|uniref:Uncharacterized protein n=1 Tax=Myoviridae sp. ctkfK18 TaxID=2825165 RepID=A0A8S5VH34_9CAUD|nr:MAG TPA: hypothetical protein [Myoviridae sp. ctkfK18]